MSTNTSLIPSAKDLLLVFPRLAQRAGAFAYHHLPEQAGNLLSKIGIVDVTTEDLLLMDKTNTSVIASMTAAFTQGSGSAAPVLETASSTGYFSWLGTSNTEGFRGFGAMLSYFGSRWALATFTMSILLNRTHFYASSRQNLEMKWKTRMILYGIPVALLSLQALWLLQAIKCQTSPDFSTMRYGNSSKQLSLNFGGEGGFLHNVSSLLLFWQDDADSCAATHMAKNDDDVLSVVGSFSLIWPFFLTICVSGFVETLACALQGRQPRPETGMTMFEHSLAFAECEAMISTAFGLGAFAPAKHDKPVESGSGTAGDPVLLTRSMILNKLNVPPEVLLICLVSSLSHLSSALLAITGKRQKFRLANTTVWAFCYLSAFIWSFVRVIQNPFGTDLELGFLFFPTVCIIGFIPHILILCGIAICGTIYTLALFVTVISPPPDSPAGISLKERFSAAFHNLQANVQFSTSSSVRINWQEDFYTNLLKIGFAILTAASEAVYLNEGDRVKVHAMTWLERKRIHELSSGKDGMPYGVSDASIAGITSGYAKERKARPKESTDKQNITSESGLGLADRRSRWISAGELLDGVAILTMRSTARFFGVALTLTGITYRPAWLLRMAGLNGAVKMRTRTAGSRPDTTREFWLIGPNGELRLPTDTEVDVERETRQRMLAMSGKVTNDAVDNKLYSWWKGGGWWGELDSSGDYVPSQSDDDMTSVISASETVDTDIDWETDDGSGRQTPTQETPYPERSQAINMQDLARLLNPRTAEDRDEARVLSQHLQSDTIMTRSQYRRRLNADRSRVLLPHASRAANADLDEEMALEQFILSEREKVSAKASAQGESWASGAAGMGASGPQCVVCQSAPRSILVWPCGCLSVCDDCRVGVAARNFGSCLCCRTNVVAYSRLYVP